MAAEGVGPAQTPGAPPRRMSTASHLRAEPEAEADNAIGLVTAMVNAKVHYGHKVRHSRIWSDNLSCTHQPSPFRLHHAADIPA